MRASPNHKLNLLKSSISRAVGRKRILVATILATLLGLGSLQAAKSSFGTTLEQQAIQFMFQLRGEREPPKSVLLVRVDQQAYEAVGLQVEQTHLLKLFTDTTVRLKKHGAKAIFFDYLFSDQGGSEPSLAFADALAESPSAIGHYYGADVDVDPQGEKSNRRYRLLPDKNMRSSTDVFDTAVAVIHGKAGYIDLGLARGTSIENP